jgi:hypothetical protein
MWLPSTTWKGAHLSLHETYALSWSRVSGAQANKGKHRALPTSAGEEGSVFSHSLTRNLFYQSVPLRGSLDLVFLQHSVP